MMNKVLFKYHDWKNYSICYEATSTEDIYKQLSKVNYKFKRDLFYLISNIKSLSEKIYNMYPLRNANTLEDIIDNEDFMKFFEKVYDAEFIIYEFDEKYIKSHKKLLEQYGKLYYNCSGGVHTYEIGCEVKYLK